jgi:hypothetical protein
MCGEDVVIQGASFCEADDVKILQVGVEVVGEDPVWREDVGVPCAYTKGPRVLAV